MDWYYVKDGQQQGPVTRDALDRLVAGGVLPAETLVWHEGLAQWQSHAATSPDRDGAAATIVAPKPDVAPAGDQAERCTECGQSRPAAPLVAFGARRVSGVQRVA